MFLLLIACSLAIYVKGLDIFCCDMVTVVLLDDFCGVVGHGLSEKQKIARSIPNTKIYVGIV